MYYKVYKFRNDQPGYDLERSINEAVASAVKPPNQSTARVCSTEIMGRWLLVVVEIS